MPVSKKYYVDFVQWWAGKGKDVHQEAKVDKNKFAERGEKTEKLRLKVQLLADGSQSLSMSALVAMTQNHASLGL